MKVLFDYQIFYLQRFGGISNVFTQLLKNMPGDVKCELALSESDNVHLRDCDIMDVPPMTCTPQNFITNKTFKGKGDLYNFVSTVWPSRTSLGRNRKASIDAIKRGDYDIFHPTFFDSYFLPYLKDKPFVLHVHDMIPEIFSLNSDHQVEDKRRLAKQATHFIAVSEKTKQDLVNLLHVPENKVTVIYHGMPSQTTMADKKAIVDGNYILYVGNRWFYKNFTPMFKELKPVLLRHKELKIVCTGPVFNPEEIKLFKDNHLENRMIHLHPTDEELQNLYAHALCFIFPSLYEGFGIPILESWQAQCPALLNNKSCFPEIAGDAGVFFNLDDSGSDLEQVLEDFLKISGDERQAIIDKQNKRLADFSWKKAAEQTVEVYRNILQS